MDELQPSLSEVEYGQRRRVPKREAFLKQMDAVVPWVDWVALIEPHYYSNKRGRRAVPIETMLRMYLLQVWFHLSDEGVEDQINDSFAMRQFMGLDFGRQQVPDATTLLHFRHLLEKHQLGEAMFASLNAKLEADGLVMRGGSIVDATIIAAPSSTKNATGTRDPAMRQTKKGNQWYFGMKAHAGVDAGTGLVHSITVTAASVHDLDAITNLVRADDQVVYADAGYQGVEKRSEIINDEHLAQVEWGCCTHERVETDAPPRTGNRVPQGIGASQGRACVPGHQARLRVRQDPLPRAGQEPPPPPGRNGLSEPAHDSPGHHDPGTNEHRDHDRVGRRQPARTRRKAPRQAAESNSDQPETPQQPTTRQSDPPGSSSTNDQRIPRCVRHGVISQTAGTFGRAGWEAVTKREDPEDGVSSDRADRRPESPVLGGTGCRGPLANWRSLGRGSPR